MLGGSDTIIAETAAAAYACQVPLADVRSICFRFSADPGLERRNGGIPVSSGPVDQIVSELAVYGVAERTNEAARRQIQGHQCRPPQCYATSVDRRLVGCR